MFNRITLKTRAKTVLSLHYWPTFLIVVLTSAISSCASTILLPTIPAMNTPVIETGNMAVFGLSFVLTMVLSLVLQVFVGTPLNVGLRRFLLDSSTENKADISTLFYAFKTGYKSIAVAGLMKSLIILLYSLLPIAVSLSSPLLLILFEDAAWLSGTYAIITLLLTYITLIPIISKTYEYYLVEYLLAENPELHWRDALEKSAQLMHGNRWFAFKLDLSFIGWILLGALACGVGIMFVEPYIYQTQVQLYLELSDKNEPETESYTVEL